MAGDAIIRDARADDLAQVVTMLADDPIGATRERPGEPLDEAYRDAFAAMAATGGGNRLIVAERDGRIVGCLQFVLIPGIARTGMLRAQIEGVRVHRDERGSGLGRRLFEWAIREARARGAGMVQLTTDKTRPDARRFYEELGFRASHEGMKLQFDP